MCSDRWRSFQKRTKDMRRKYASHAFSTHFIPNTLFLVLRVKPQDADASRTKLFLLLQTEQYEPALTLLDQVDAATAQSFEKAYAFYGLHREQDAMDEVVGIKQRASNGAIPRGVSLLEAQLVSIH